jgi:hypothetical protein
MDTVVLWVVARGTSVFEASGGPLEVEALKCAGEERPMELGKFLESAAAGAVGPIDPSRSCQEKLGGEGWRR